jgi:hypothetical protein
MMTRALLLLLVLPACPPANSRSEGPEIRFTVIPSNSSNFNQDTLQPELHTDIDTNNYDFTLEVYASFGETLSGTKYTYAPVGELEGTVTPPGVNLTEADFDYDMTTDVLRSRTFDSKMMFSIPGTMMGQMVTFTMQATDEEGLRSNTVSFSALLD